MLNLHILMIIKYFMKQVIKDIDNYIILIILINKKINY